MKQFFLVVFTIHPIIKCSWSLDFNLYANQDPGQDTEQ